MISAANIQDIPSLLHLVNNSYRGEKARKGWTHEADIVDGDVRIDESSLKEMIQNPNAVVLKYVENDKVIGCVHLEKQSHKLYLGMLSVLPQKQAQGVGKKLLKASEAFAKENNFNTIEMTVISMRNELIAWYERNGYKKTGETKPFPDDGKFGNPKQPVEFIVLQKKLLKLQSADQP